MSVLVFSLSPPLSATLASAVLLVESEVDVFSDLGVSVCVSIVCSGLGVGLFSVVSLLLLLLLDTVLLFFLDDEIDEEEDDEDSLPVVLVVLLLFSFVFALVT